jgi:hypothetical protein
MGVLVGNGVAAEGGSVGLSWGDGSRTNVYNSASVVGKTVGAVSSLSEHAVKTPTSAPIKTSKPIKKRRFPGKTHFP